MELPKQNPVQLSAALSSSDMVTGSLQQVKWHYIWIPQMQALFFWDTLCNLYYHKCVFKKNYRATISFWDGYTYNDHVFKLVFDPKKWLYDMHTSYCWINVNSSNYLNDVPK